MRFAQVVVFLFFSSAVVAQQTKVDARLIKPSATATSVLTTNASGATEWVGSAAWLSSLNVLTGGGTSNYVAKFSSANTLGNSNIYDSGTSVGINNFGSFLTSGRLEINDTWDNTMNTNMVLTGAIPGFTIRNGTRSFAMLSSYNSSDILTLMGGGASNANPSTQIALFHADGNVVFPAATTVEVSSGKVIVEGYGSAFGATSAPNGVDFYVKTNSGRVRFEGNTGLSYVDFFSPNLGSSRNYSFATSYFSAGDFNLLRSSSAGGTPDGIVFSANPTGFAVGGSDATATLDVNGSARFRAEIHDATNSAGSNGNVLVSTGSATQWTASGGDVSGGYSNLQLGSAVVGQPELAANSVTASKIVDGEIGTSELASAAVTGEKLAALGATVTGQVPLWNNSTGKYEAGYLRPRDTVFLSIPVLAWNTTWPTAGGVQSEGYPLRVPSAFSGATIIAATYSVGIAGGGSGLAQDVQVRRMTSGGATANFGNATINTGDVRKEIATTFTVATGDLYQANLAAGTFSSGNAPKGLVIILTIVR